MTSIFSRITVLMIQEHKATFMMWNADSKTEVICIDSCYSLNTSMQPSNSNLSVGTSV